MLAHSNTEGITVTKDVTPHLDRPLWATETFQPSVGQSCVVDDCLCPVEHDTQIVYSNIKMIISLPKSLYLVLVLLLPEHNIPEYKLLNMFHISHLCLIMCLSQFAIQKPKFD